MKKKYIALFILIFSFTSQAQIINIPDVNLKNKLLNNNNVIDTNDNGEIEVSEASISLPYISLTNAGIQNLEGMQYFTNVNQLFFDNNNITSLQPIEGLVNLKYLTFSHNQVTSANLLNLTNLKGLDISYNQITAIDLPPIHEGIQSYLVLSGNLYTSLAVNPSTNVSTFICENTQLVSLDLSHMVSNFNPIPEELDYRIKNNPHLEYLNVKNGYDEMYKSISPSGWKHVEFSGNPLLSYICADAAEINAYQNLINTASNNNNPNAVATSYCSFTPGGDYNTITGNVFFDCNGLNIPLQNQQITISNVSNPELDFANTVGNFHFYAGTGSYTVTPTSINPDYFNISPANYAFNFTTLNNTETTNFCLTPNGVHPDLDIVIIPITRATPGFDAKYKIVFTNKGNQVQSGSIVMQFDDSVLDLISASPSINSSTTNTLNWDFTNLVQFESREITIKFSVNLPSDTPPVAIGDVLNYQVNIVTVQIDDTPSDNQMSFNQTVVGSFDPNDKTVVEGSQIDISKIGDYLHYVVHFQNTGTASADNVVIKDMLNAKLDWSTLEMVSASHPYRSTLTAGNKLEVFFEGIDLPASSIDEEGSHGYIAYKIKPKSTVILNDVISNTANIYFDYNFPIITNTVTTTVTALGTPTFNQDKLFSVYPNPASNQLNIMVLSVATIKSVSISNALGQKISIGNSPTINISSLARGAYFITVETDKGKATQKFIKQ